MTKPMNNFLNKLERMVRRIAIPNLMLYISAGMLLVYLMTYLFPGSFVLGGQESNLFGLLALERYGLFHGQLWRLITFMFLPPSTSILFILFSLYFYYLIGVNLERHWGTARFNLYYLLGIIGSILAALITGYGTNTFLNYSLFFAFAVLFPDTQIMLFFVIPIKIKYLAFLNAAFFAISLVVAVWRFDWATVASILASLINFFLFFGGDFFRRIREQRKYAATRRNFRRQMDRNSWQ